MTSRPEPRSQGAAPQARRAVVVGATGGIGAAAAAKLGDHGCRVVALDLSSAGPAIVSPVVGFAGCDISDEVSVESALAAAAGLLGGIDVVVNAAGVVRRSTLPQTSVSEWDEVMGVNARGSFLLAKYAFPYLAQGTSPRLILVASQLGLVAIPGAAAYCASKGAVIQLARALAVDWAEAGIAVSAVCPGPTRTAMVESRLTASSNPDEERRRLQATMLTGRLIEPTEVGELIAFLARPDMASLTGSALIIDGGYTAV